MSIDRIERVAVVGTGVIGASWAAYFLARGLAVSAHDPAPGARERLTATIARHWPTLERIGLAERASMSNLAFHDDLESALSGAQFVQENGPEREDLKLELLGRIDAVLPDDVVIASSTSGLLMSRMQRACRHPERVVLGHPFNPPHLIPLVEVIGGEATSAASIERAMAFYRAIGKRPIHPRREMMGHIANRLQAALWREAFHLVSTGAASVADIDDAIVHGPGLRWSTLGPFATLHLSGGEGGIGHTLDHLGPPIQSWWDDLGAPRLTPELQRKVVEEMQAALAGRSREAMEAERNRAMLMLLKAREA